MIIDSGRLPDLQAECGARWVCITDQVMGGVSTATLQRCVIDGQPALHLQGSVRLDNNGGFVQMAIDLAPRGAVFDASGYQGLRLRVRGNGAGYNVHLRSADMVAVWQSWRAGFVAGPDWADVTLPFSAFTPHRTDLAVNPARLRRLGIVAIGREMAADLAVAQVAFIRLLPGADRLAATTAKL